MFKTAHLKISVLSPISALRDAGNTRPSVVEATDSLDKVQRKNWVNQASGYDSLGPGSTAGQHVRALTADLFCCFQRQKQSRRQRTESR